MGHIFAFMTATRVDPETLEETHGWIDPTWSNTELLDSRNDATPVVDMDELDDDLTETVADALGSLGQWDDNGDGTVYGADSVQSQEDGAYWTYALHFVRKFLLLGNGYTEEPWNPFTELDL